ncbi:hypothetical protein TNCV_4933701, partial [Trichonephila clavipes]
MREDACVRTPPAGRYIRETEDFQFDCRRGSITRIATFMDNVSEHVDITELEVKLKKLTNSRGKLKIERATFGLETSQNQQKKRNFEEDLHKCETRLDELE